MALTDQKRAELEAEHESIATVETPDGTLAFRRPKAAEYQRFTDKVGGGKTSAGARELASVCIVYPDKDSAKAILEKYPAVPVTVAEALNRLAGGDFEIEVSKG